MPKPIRVFILDDHDLIRRGLRQLVDSFPDLTVVGEASTATDALELIPQVRPDVAVLDVRLPDASGVEVCRDLQSRDAPVPCLMLTAFNDDEALFAALMAGAAGYLLKEVEGASLVSSIRTAAAGGSVIDSAAAHRVLDRMKRAEQPDVPPELAGLTATEREILALIAEGLSNREIAARIYLAEKTVKNYVTSILAKLEVTRRTQAAVLASRLL